MYNFSASGILILQTIVVCCIIYTGIIWAIGQVFTPNKAEGSLLHNSHGIVIGSYLISQRFTELGYFWSRPSAVDYNAAGSGGSNLSPTNPALRNRIEQLITLLEPTSGKPIPVELLMASGSGLDPDLTLQGAMFQADRVAKARGLDIQAVRSLVYNHATRPNIFFGNPSLVNVLELNLLLDRELPGLKQ